MIYLNRQAKTKSKHTSDTDRKSIIGDILFDLREQRGYTQKEIADMLHVTVSSISHYEKGVSVPPTDIIIKLANFYDVSADYLLNNCTSKINYCKILDQQITHSMTIGNAVESILTMSKKERSIVASIISLIENQSGKTK